MSGSSLVTLETVRNDPEYKDGNYTTQPRSMKTASVFFLG
jgi:hypothetical protein